MYRNGTLITFTRSARCSRAHAKVFRTASPRPTRMTFVSRPLTYCAHPRFLQVGFPQGVRVFSVPLKGTAEILP